MDWTEIIITVDAANIDSAGDIAQMVVPYGIYIEDYRTLEAETWAIAHVDLIDETLLSKDRSKGLIHVYISPEETPAEAVAFLSERYTAENISHTISTKLCKNEDWENNWKAYFKPMPVGRRLLIRPVWDDDFEADGRVVFNIEPGLAFGNGGHETTRLSLEALEPYITTASTVLDIGCGSGILSVAALLLGAKSAVGVDIDKLAVKTARDNGRLNGFEEPAYTVLNGNLVDKVSGKFDIVVANIVADIIILFCRNVAEYLNPNGVFIASGIIDLREKDVLAAFEQYGFRVINRHEEGGWICFETVVAER
jgi:ribosomal protein L11 methyltransferase